MKRFFILLMTGLMTLLLVWSCKSSKDKQLATKDEPIASLDMAKKMGRGFNLGNTFDAYNQVWQSHEFPQTKKIIDLYRARGMENIRIPITWMQEHEDGILADNDGRILVDHPRFQDLVATIDYALAQGFYVVINTHHEHWLKDHFDGSEVMTQRFHTLWTEIATYFQDYPYKLMFEVLNEPEGVFGDWSLSQGIHPANATGIALTRTINDIGYEAIRKSGGKNRERMVIVAPNGQGNHSQMNAVYPERALLPGGGNDPYVMVAGHSYDPWDFCGQNGSNLHYQDRDIEQLRQDLKSVVDGAKGWSEKNGVGVYFGEYGVGRDGRGSERDTMLVREYYRYLTQLLIEAEISTAVWDDKGWFGILNPDGDGFQFVYGLIEALMGIETRPDTFDEENDND